jgi:serine protease Do
LIRDGREQTVTIKLAERPPREPGERPTPTEGARPAGPEKKVDAESRLGLTVRDLDRATADRLEVPKQMKGVVIARVEPMSSAFDSDVTRGSLLLELNRQRVESVADYRRLARGVHAGDIVTLYLYVPDLDQRKLVTVRVDDR